jgi:hypothetical protein
VKLFHEVGGIRYPDLQRVWGCGVGLLLISRFPQGVATLTGVHHIFIEVVNTPKQVALTNLPYFNGGMHCLSPIGPREPGSSNDTSCAEIARFVCPFVVEQLAKRRVR